MELVKSKIAGGQPVISKAPERGNVVNLMDALRRSIEEERRPPAPSLGKAAAAPAKAGGEEGRPQGRPVASRRQRRRKPPDAHGAGAIVRSRSTAGSPLACATGWQAAIAAGGGAVARDLTRRSDALVVGALAAALIDCGALGARLRRGARARPADLRRARLRRRAGRRAGRRQAHAAAGHRPRRDRARPRRRRALRGVRPGRPRRRPLPLRRRARVPHRRGAARQAAARWATSCAS